MINFIPLKKLFNRNWRSEFLSFLKSESSPDRFLLFFRGNLLVFMGYIIATLETLIGINFGLTDLTYVETFTISSSVLVITLILTVITVLTRIRLVWHEVAIFSLYLVTFLFAFCIWVFWLGELRFLGILNGFTAVTIVLSYTSAIQSLIMSTSTLICYYSMVWYSIKIAGQPGSIAKETFFALCLIPAFILISAAAYYMNKRRKDLQAASFELERLNINLTEANNELKNKQSLTEIEMDLASEIQNAIFPGKAPVVLDWEIAFITKPYGAVTGDFYDFYCPGDSLKGISLFDVSGHGVAPALITILAKPVLYSYFNQFVNSRLGKVVESANKDLIEELEAVNLYITGLLLRMNGHEVEYVNAGHPDLLLIESSSGEVHIIQDSSNTFKGHPIGISHSMEEYKSHKFNVEQGDSLIFYSDGLTEGRNPKGEQFGIPRLVNVLKSSKSIDASGVLNRIMADFKTFTGDAKPADDITVIVIKKR